jgi:hypothetical protein
MGFQQMETATKPVAPAMTVVEVEPLLDERDIAKITKRSLASIRRDRLMRKGVPFIRIGSSVRYRPDALRDFLGSCVVGGTQRTEAA